MRTCAPFLTVKGFEAGPSVAVAARKSLVHGIRINRFISHKCGRYFEDIPWLTGKVNRYVVNRILFVTVKLKHRLHRGVVEGGDELQLVTAHMHWMTANNSQMTIWLKASSNSGAASWASMPTCLCGRSSLRCGPGGFKSALLLGLRGNGALTTLL